MADVTFFDEASDASQVKAQIVKKYFWAWAKVVLPHSRSGRIGYVDLFAGPGRYKSQTKSTPLLVLETAINDPKMRQALVAYFNDIDSANCQSLQSEINDLSDIKTLKHKPHVSNVEIGSEIVKEFEEVNLIPTLCFVDPWGYKGLSLRLINAILKDWACECIFFFNYNRINMGINNSVVEEHMNALFGKGRADALRAHLGGLPPEEREIAVVEAISQALVSLGSNYVLPFRFKSSEGSRTSHHLIFASKHPKGYEIMKEIMAKESSSENDGVPSFEYNPATIRQPLLLELSRPIEELGEMLCHEYVGRTLPMRQIYESHNVGRQYIAKNYKKALSDLEAQGKIVADPPATERRKQKGIVTFADTVSVSFPKRQI